MKNLNYARLAVAGFTTYAAVFMLWTFMYTYGFAGGLAAQIVSYSATFVVILIATYVLGIRSWGLAAICGIVWTIMHIGFDLVFVVPVAGIESLTTISIMIGYGIVLVSPFIASLLAPITKMP